MVGDGLWRCGQYPEGERAPIPSVTYSTRHGPAGATV
jgi:hypothetical protein